VPHNLTGDQLATLAGHTAGYSGADIEELVIDAKRQAAKRDAQAVSLEDFLALERIQASTEQAPSDSSPEINLNDRSNVGSPRDDHEDDSTVGFQ
jgi:ATP-dependent Zn protease